MVKLETIRVTQFQYFSVMVIVILTSFVLFPGGRKIDGQSTFISLIHLGSWAANYGAQLWVTLVAGLTMFYNLPRHMFGKVQSRLFPMFFLWSLVTAAVQLGTFVAQHPMESWQSAHTVEVVTLTTGFLTAAMNSLILSPLIVKAMVKTFRLEVEAGITDVIGHADVTELKKDPIYRDAYRMFRRYHGLGALMTLAGLASNSIHLYYLTCQCVPI
ncbi:transmembrane protein 205-like [Gigantopelta aegis]|uniref:transmembrane protein 205-like n=1 Tax=Gigantopelta aegis TaxID=1735272 RepID=UPI001B88AE03|nr:transmembrane protein 205-like [Gigantopelta aegis]